MYRDDRKQSRSGCSVIFFIFLIIVIAIGLYYWLFTGRVPKQVVLEADFEQAMIESAPDDGLARVMMTKKLRVRDVVEALQKASQDDRVKGLVARVGQSRVRLAQVQEVRDAIIAFRASGKPAIAYAETFGEAGPGNTSYYLATAFDAIYLQPSGDVGLTGLIYEQPFVRGTLDKLGIIPRIDGRKEYKSYRYMFTEKKYLPPHREAITRAMESQFSQIVGGIAAARKLTEDEVLSLINEGPYLGRQAVDAKLIDGLGYRDEVYDRIKKKAGAKAELLPLAEYRKRAGSPCKKGTTIALVYGVGGIMRGKSGYEPATGEIIMGSDTIASAIREAVEDEEVKAILFRIDSPGGSYVASDTIWREIMSAKKAGKPVIASMGGTAASGGYFIAMAADKIVAQPGTITGSIGVFGGKLITTGFWNKLGVTWDEVHTSKNANAWSQTSDFTPEQRARFSQWLDRVYDDFTTKVSTSRKLSMEDVEKIAKGRIWTGEDAKKLGLVDELGGFPAALRLVRIAAKLPENAPVRLKVFPEKKSLVKIISDLKSFGAEDENESALARTLEEVQPLLKTIGSLGPSSRSGVLRLPDYGWNGEMKQ
ncbi:MAG: signal peptide peptidase SppA [Nitrospirae bacterium]|nr:signal peptide peptidase SppA [Nitrospirota bacterium]